MKALNKLSDEEILELKDAVKDGSLMREIENRFSLAKKQCPVCTSPVKEGELTLHFEEGAFRKKASFCGKDCLQYFLNNHTKTKVFETSEKLDKNI